LQADDTDLFLKLAFAQAKSGLLLTLAFLQADDIYQDVFATRGAQQSFERTGCSALLEHWAFPSY